MYRIVRLFTSSRKQTGAQNSNRRHFETFSYNIYSLFTNKRDRGIPLRRTFVRPDKKQEQPEAQYFAKRLRQIIDRQALLIMRELSMNVRRFQDLQAQTKICSPLLSSRLRRLEKDGIIERRLYLKHPPRYEYFATAKGGELDAVLFAAGNWDIRWGGREEAPSWTVYDKVTGKRLSAAPAGTREEQEAGLRS
jgi:DNA-binding HxlR family transcriptional regulator